MPYYTYIMQKIKLSRWFKENDISYQAAYRQYKAGAFPEPIWGSPTNRLYVLVNSNAIGSQTAGLVMDAKEQVKENRAKRKSVDVKKASEKVAKQVKKYK